MKRIGRLHVLTDTVLQSRYSHLKLAELAVAGGADTIEFRQKSGSTREMIDLARDMKRLCSEAGVTFIVNDRLDVALAADADGVHLGQDDFPITLARELLPEGRIIGGTAKTLEQIERCRSDGADYVGFGPVFPTGSKADAGTIKGIALLRQMVEAAGLPIIAIGGIKAENAAEVMRAGAHGIAVISAVCCQDDPETAARVLCQALGRGDR